MAVAVLVAGAGARRTEPFGSNTLQSMQHRAVATGKHSLDDLRACGPDMLVPNLADTDRLLAFLVAAASADSSSPRSE